MRDLRYAAWIAGLGCVAALPLLAGFTRPAWELSEVLGLIAALVCLALCGCPVRPRESTPPVLLSVGRHEVLGWIALGAAGLHILCAVLSDHTVLVYFLPTSPLYQLAGIAAFIVLIVLAVTARAAARRRLWHSHRNFQAVHIIAGCALALLVAVHVVTTARYTGGYGRRILYLAVAAGGIGLLLRRRRGAGGARPEASLRRFAFGRHSTLVFAVTATVILALSALIAGRAGMVLREPIEHRDNALPLNFDHARHTSVNCLTCHHNYADGRGFDSCVHCHRSSRADLVVGAEARFHGFCLDCHRHPAPQLTEHGPVSGCAACHAPAAAPN